jgi:hypothetical protein
MPPHMALFQTAVRRPMTAMLMLAPSASCETESMRLPWGLNCL